MADHDRRRAIFRHITGAIRQPTARDEQKSIGPSEIGDPCGWCVGKALCRKYPEHWWGPAEDLKEEHFSLKAWTGTAVHEKLERDVRGHIHGYGQFYKEATVPIVDLDGYGLVKGHVDVLAPATVLDYKNRDLNDIRKIKLSGVLPQKELVQTNLYGHGARQLGMPVEDLCTIYIPRDSNYPEDIFPAFLEPSEAVVERSLERLSSIWETVRSGRGDTLKPFEGGDKAKPCYSCVLRYKLSR